MTKVTIFIQVLFKCAFSRLHFQGILLRDTRRSLDLKVSILSMHCHRLHVHVRPNLQVCYESGAV